MSTTSAVLSAEGVAVIHGPRRLLDGVDLRLHAGEIVLLAGRNGAGKSTMLRLLIGAQRPARGRITLGERPLDRWSDRERARQLAYVAQDSDSPFEFTGRQLVAMGRHCHRQRMQPLSAADHDAIEAALAVVHAVEFAGRPVTTLSGGELRRIAIARSLATQAPLLLLDEPTNNLDLEHALLVASVLRELASSGRGVLVASHDLNLLAPVADRVVLLHEGHVHADGPPQEVLSARAFADAFGVVAADPAGYFPRDFRPSGSSDSGMQ